MTVQLKALGAADIDAAERLLDRVLGGRHQARLGEVVDVLAASGIVAWYGDELAGVVTWTVGSDPSRAELAALAIDEHNRGRGLGALLTEAATDAAWRADCTAMWLVTTNDNLDAIRLYQRHGFRLVELRAGAVDQARLVKSTIPEIGQQGIPMHDELVLERRLP